MKKVRFILAGLLAAMLFFTVHDYILSQADISDTIQKEKTVLQMEHSVFHTPIILTSCDSDYYIEFEDKSDFSEQNFKLINFTNSLFKPPQFS